MPTNSAKVLACLKLTGAFATGVLLALLSLGCQHTSPRFYPLGLYSPGSTNALPVIRAAGFNLVTGPATTAFLNAAAKNHLKVLASPGTSAGPHFNRQAAERTLRQFDCHPALWAWYLIDEPDLNLISPEQVTAANDYLKSLAPRKPTALVLYQGYNAYDYGGITDLLMVDRYPIPWLPLANFPQHIQMARFALGHHKRLIAVIQAFDWNAYPQLLPQEKHLRPPSFAELRCMTYCALLRGANGLFYYAYDAGRWRLPDRPKTWNALKQVVREVRDRLPLFRAQRLWWAHDVRNADYSHRFNAALEASVAAVLLRVGLGNDAVAPGDYLLAVNTTPRPQVFSITAPRTVRSIPVLEEDRSISLNQRWLTDYFEPYGVHVYGPIPSW